MKKFREYATILLLAASFSFAGVTTAHANLADEILHGYSLIDQWRLDEAEAHIKFLLKKYPRLGDAHFLNAKVIFYRGHYDKAWKTLQTIEEKRPSVKEFKSLVEQTRDAAADFVTQESEHFIFRYTDGPDEVLVQYAEEALEKSYQVLGGILDYYPKEKVIVEFYPQREPFAKISPLTLKDIVTSGTVALCKYHRIMMISPGSLVRGYNWMDTLSHEFTHFLLSKKSNNNVPLWLHEGIAKYLESRWRGAKPHLSPIMETVLANGLANDYLVPLEDMMPSLAKLKTAEDVQLAYAEVATMVEYMVELKGETVIAALVNDLKKEIPIESALMNVLDLDMEAFQSGWKKFTQGKELTTIPGLKVLKFRFKDNQTASSDEEDTADLESSIAHDLTLLGDILKTRNHLQAATIEYEKAIKESKVLSPILYNKLAGTYLLKKEFNRAEELLKKNLRYYPMFPTTLINLGEVYYQQKKHETAEKFFEQAIRINPFNPYVHIRLINIYETLGKTREKELQGRLYSYIE